MNEYEKTINEINSGLTGNTKQDYSYLLEQAEKYKQHPMSHEILKEIGRKIYYKGAVLSSRCDPAGKAFACG